MRTHLHLPQRDTAQPPIFGPCLLRPNGWVDQNATWYGGRPRPRRLCVMGPRSFSPKGGGAPKNFRPCLLWPNGWMDHDGTWHGGRPPPRRPCGRWGPSPPPQKGAQPPNFRPMFILAKRLDGSRWHLAWRWALVQATLC